MTVKELIEKLSLFNPDSQVLIQYMNADAYGSCWKDREDFDEDDVRAKEDDVRAKEDIVIIDISDRYP